MSLYNKRQVMEWFAKHQNITLKQAITKLASAPVDVQKAILAAARRKMEKEGYVPPVKYAGRPKSKLKSRPWPAKWPEEPVGYIALPDGTMYKHESFTRGRSLVDPAFEAWGLFLPCEMHDGPGYWTLGIRAEYIDDAERDCDHPARQALEKEHWRVVDAYCHYKAEGFYNERDMIRHVRGEDT